MYTHMAVLAKTARMGILEVPSITAFPIILLFCCRSIFQVCCLFRASLTPFHRCQEAEVGGDSVSAIGTGSVSSTLGLGPTLIAWRQNIGISIGMLPETLIMSITFENTSTYYTTEFDLEEELFHGACISISNLLENIALQTHTLEARSPLKSGACGGRPNCHSQSPPVAAGNNGSWSLQ